MADEDEKGYRWETEYEKTWEALIEDDAGSLQASVDDIIQKAKKRRLLEKIGNIRLGMLCEKFIEEYFDQNPISQLGILTTRNKRAEKLTELGGNPRRHITALQGLSDRACQGEPSLQNSMELAMQTLKHMPSHASREVLVVLGSLSTCDPGDIDATIKNLEELNVRCSVIGLAAEVRVCKKLCHKTHGKYNVILDESHFKDLLYQHVSPPPATSNTESSLIRMGFPHHTLNADRAQEEKPSMCMCHADGKSGSQGFSNSGYFCPQCKSKYCELPIECKACGLTLVSAPHLARSYHHLFPLPAFKETPVSDLSANPKCYSCQIQITEQNVYICESCSQLFCLDCDLFIHETLHSCPGCSSFRGTQLQSQIPMIT